MTEVLPSAAEYKPGQKAKVKVHVTDHTGENFVGSTVMTVYDKAVEYISGGSNVPDIKEFFWKWRRHHHPQTMHNLAQWSPNMGLPGKPQADDVQLSWSSRREWMETIRRELANRDASTHTPRRTHGPSDPLREVASAGNLA